MGIFSLDKRINGNTLSVDDFFSKVNKKLNKDNTKILQEQVCYLDDGSGDFFVLIHCPNNHFFTINNRLHFFK
jgi:hypothetical protein